jgi:hypothetical protein
MSTINLLPLTQSGDTSPVTNPNYNILVNTVNQIIASLNDDDSAYLLIAGNSFSGSGTQKILETLTNPNGNLMYSLKNDINTESFFRIFGSTAANTVFGIAQANSTEFLTSSGNIIMGGLAGNNYIFYAVNGAIINYETSYGNNVITPPAPVTYNTSASLAATDLLSSVIINSGAAVNFTLPTANSIGTALPLSVTRGTNIEFVIDNSAGSGNVTLVLNTNITNPTSGSLIVNTGCVGYFKLYCTAVTPTFQINRL